MKPLRPFPLPISIGTDICQISRVHAILAGPRRERFLRRVLAPEERRREAARLEWAAAGAGAGAGEGAGAGAESGGRLWRVATFVAGRFAAKEAAIKAYASSSTLFSSAPPSSWLAQQQQQQQRRRLTFHDVIIERSGAAVEGGSGPPIARIRSGSLPQQRQQYQLEEDEDEDESALVSISHDGDYATAVVVAACGGR